MFGLILHIPVNNFSVMSGWVFQGVTSTKQRIKCLAQAHATVMPVMLKSYLDLQSCLGNGSAPNAYASINGNA